MTPLFEGNDESNTMVQSKWAYMLLANHYGLFMKHVASPAGDRPSVYRITTSITPPRWQYMYVYTVQTTSS